MSDICFSCRGPRCPSRRATKDEYGRDYWPSCDLFAGHDGDHRSGHVMDVLWVWTSEQAMTPDEIASWKSGAP